jgi:polyhydroxyalkanoate synthase
MRAEDLALPTLHVIPARDRIVPPESSRALAKATKGADMLSPAAGHVGMAVGSRARSEVWEPLAVWLRRL